MKKIIPILLLITIVFLTASCGNKETKDDNNEKNMPESTYSLKTDERTIDLNTEFTKDTYGEPLDYSETASCAFEGLDKTYTYEQYEITTYPKDDKEYIYSILLLDPNVKTTEGVAIDDSKDKMIEVYGEDYQEEEGNYTYTKGKTSIVFVIQDDKIISIEYLYITE